MRALPKPQPELSDCVFSGGKKINVTVAKSNIIAAAWGKF